MILPLKPESLAKEYRSSMDELSLTYIVVKFAQNFNFDDIFFYIMNYDSGRQFLWFLWTYTKQVFFCLFLFEKHRILYNRNSCATELSDIF